MKKTYTSVFWLYDSGNQQVEKKGNRQPIADICNKWDLMGNESPIDKCEVDSNGELIAAAPEMLTLLKELNKHDPDLKLSSQQWIEIENIIKKAEGMLHIKLNL